MHRTLILSLLVVGAAVALVMGAYSALANSEPGGGVGSPVVVVEEPDNGDTVDAENGEEDGDGPQAKGAQAIAQAIAETFEVSPDEVLALHDSGVGFGAIFKLHLLSAAGVGTVDELRAAAEEGEGFAFGKRFKELAGEGAALSAGEDGMPKNLGQAISAAKKGGKGAAAAAYHASNGHGPPGHAPVHGRR